MSNKAKKLRVEEIREQIVSIEYANSGYHKLSGHSIDVKDIKCTENETTCTVVYCVDEDDYHSKEECSGTYPFGLTNKESK